MGSEIIRLDPRVHYQDLGKNANRALEPGYIPIDRPPLLTTISYYPNETELSSSEFVSARQAFKRWGELGDIDSYRSAYSAWQAFRERIPFYRKWEAPLYEALDIRSEDTAWLPLVKCPLAAKTPIDGDGIDVFRDLALLWDQLNLLRPSVVLIQGAVVDAVVGKRLDNLSFIKSRSVQKIPQQPTSDMMQEQVARLVRELRPQIDALRCERP
jgi:hypothetical protein